MLEWTKKWNNLNNKRMEKTYGVFLSIYPPLRVSRDGDGVAISAKE